MPVVDLSYLSGNILKSDTFEEFFSILFFFNKPFKILSNLISTDSVYYVLDFVE